jgi:hypothetical protein
MNEDKEFSRINNPKKSVKKVIVWNEDKEEYIRIYYEYFALKWRFCDIEKHHNCTQNKIESAIKWVIQNRIRIPADWVVKGSIDAINDRVEKTRKMLDAEIGKNKRYRDNAFIIALNKEIREDEKTIFNLQKIYSDPEGNKEENLTPSQVLALIKENKSSSPAE